MLDRLNRIENNNRVKAKLAAAGMDQGMIDVVLEALNDMQERVTSQTNDKLAKAAS